MTDIVSTVLRFLDGDSKAGRLVTALVEWSGRPQALTYLAHSVNLPIATASREADRLVELGLVQQQRTGRERLLRLDENSGYADLVRELVFLALGVRAHPDPDRAENASGYRAPFEVSHVLKEFIPPSLRSEHYAIEFEPAGNVLDGPPLVHARTRVQQLRALTVRLATLESRLQDSYSRWRDQRDRDLIHLVGTLGAGAGQAAHVLEAFSGPRTAQDPAVLGRAVWTHAVYALDAEVRIDRGTAATLARAMSRGDAARRAVRRHREERERLERLRERDPALQTALLEREVEQSLERRDAATAELAEEPTFGDRMEIGTAGERVLAVEIDQLAGQAQQLLVSMAAHPCFGAWQREHPGEARAVTGAGAPSGTAVSV